MILDLRQFEHFPARAEVQGRPDEFTGLPEEIRKIREVTLRVAIQRSNEEYFCQGTVEASVDLECSRCLTEFEAEISGKTDFIARSDANAAAGRKDIPDDEDYVLMHGNDLRADVTDIVRQTIQLALSMKPLCSEACRGLCPICGTNLNEKSCNCRRQQVDERWNGLKDLLNP